MSLIFLPMYTAPVEPPRCPYCHRVLPETRGVAFEVAAILGLLLFLAWLILTLAVWMDSSSTLLAVCEAQWAFLVNLVHRIY